MKLNLKTLFSVAAFASILALTGCSEKEAPVIDSNNKITVGVIAGSEAQIAEIAAQVAKNKFGLDVTLITFSDYITPNAALDEGSIDINAYQHKPYLEQQVKDRGYEFTNVGNTFVYPIAGYSNKINSLDELKDGDQIAVPSDPTNLGRSLILLEAQNLLTLKEGVGLSATVRDIVSNPKKLKIIKLEAPQLPRSLDKVALAIINTTYASAINLSPKKDGLFVEDKNSPYINIIVARTADKDAQNIQNFIKAYQSEEVYKAALDIFKGGVVKGW
jgi:D-methionine transport system substrate-binding protein